MAIRLESNPSTGYSCEVVGIDMNGLHQVGKTEFEQTSLLLGAPERQILRFKPVGGGRSTLKLVYHRLWEKGIEPAREFSIQVAGCPATTSTWVEPVSWPEEEFTKPTVKESMRLELTNQGPAVEPEATNIRVTSPPAPLGWNQPDFVLGGSWQPGSAVWWADWAAPDWCPLTASCSPVGFMDEYGNQEA